MPAKTPKTSVKTTQASRTTPASHDAPESSTPDSATRLHKALTVLHAALGQPTPENVAPTPRTAPGEPPASLPSRPAPDQAVASLAGTYAALEAYAASPRGTTGDANADREPFDELAEYRERRPAVQSTPHAPAARPTLASERDADGPEGDRPGLVFTPSTFDVTKFNGYITITSPKTGDHRTFRILTVDQPGSFFHGKRIVSMLIGPNRELETNWKGFGFVDSFGVAVWRKDRGTITKSEFEKYANILENPARFEGRGVEFLFAGHCRRCNALLTNATSLKDGLGPVCRTKV